MKTRILSAALLAAILCSCGGNKPTETSKADSTANPADASKKPTEELNLAGDVVCIWEGVPVMEEPNKKSKWKASISLGETVKYLDETQTDPTDSREYYKVELYDGKTGWAPSYGLILDSKLGAIIGELAIVYKRPQLAAISDKKLAFMEIVAVGKSEGDFVEVFGPKKTISGWVKKGDITTQDNDVTAAILAYKMIPADATGEALEAKLKDFMAAAPKDSPFYVRLNEKYNDLVATREQADAPKDSTGDN